MPISIIKRLLNAAILNDTLAAFNWYLYVRRKEK
jgi:hypothetical protein